MPNSPWWKGTRGEWYFVVQLVLLGLILFAPFMPGQPVWPPPGALIARGLGLLLGLAGFALAMAGLLGLGANLSPLPHPKDDTTLVEGGAFAMVRHPIYVGLISGSLGWALLTNSLLAVGLAGGVCAPRFAFRRLQPGSAVPGARHFHAGRGGRTGPRDDARRD
jgi:protein-S-isoprenylcysteine O-methyltransferase Ste14